MRAPFAAGAFVSIDGKGCHRVQSCGAVDGGLYLLRLEQEGGADVFTLEIQWLRDGTWRTEELEEVTVGEPGPIVETEDGSAVGTQPPEMHPCRACGAPIWWSESAKGKPTPMNADGSSHWGTCPKAAEWRGKHRTPESASPAHDEPTKPEQLELFGGGWR